MNKLEQQKDYVYFSTHEGLNAEIKDFSSLKDAIEWGRVECELHDLNKRDTVIYRVESEHISQGIDAVMKMLNAWSVMKLRKHRDGIARRKTARFLRQLIALRTSSEGKD